MQGTHAGETAAASEKGSVGTAKKAAVFTNNQHGCRYPSCPSAPEVCGVLTRLAQAPLADLHPLGHVCGRGLELVIKKAGGEGGVGTVAGRQERAVAAAGCLADALQL